MDFDVNYLRGAALVLLIIAFLGMWKWAWSDRNKADFRKMSQLPLEEDQDVTAADDAAGNQATQDGTKE